MRNGVKVVLGVAVVAVLGGAAVFFGSGNAEPTADVTAPTIPGTTEPAPTASSGDGGQATPAAGPTEFELTDETVAVFELDEELGGTPTLVVGTSDTVLGRISLDPADLSATEIGTILVNARAFTTDESLRNRAIRGVILDTDAFEFVEFAPTGIEGLDGAAAVGDGLAFTVTGDLTVRDVTREAVFDVTATLVADDRIEGVATTTVLRSDYGIAIPSVPRVANVSDEVALRLEFVASPPA
jgi:polyisoprenoid-binding protein YceI